MGQHGQPPDDGWSVLPAVWGAPALTQSDSQRADPEGSEACVLPVSTPMVSHCGLHVSTPQLTQGGRSRSKLHKYPARASGSDRR